MRASGSTRGVIVMVDRIDVGQARRRAKELLRAARAGDPGALERMRADRAPRLADAQHAVAHDLGFSSWPALVNAVNAAAGDRAQRRERLVRAAFHGRRDRVDALLEADPGLSDAGLDVALMLGDDVRVGAALEADPGLVSREVDGVGRRPLSCVCFSTYLAPDSPRVEGALRCVRLLLDAGADPDETHRNEYGDMPVLYGAAGVAHNVEAARMLLDAGANPDDNESVYHSCETRDHACLQLLLDRGAAVRGTNAVAHMVDYDDLEGLRLLLDRGGFGPDDPLSGGLVHHALLRGRSPETFVLLAEYGAPLDVPDDEGVTPYAKAVRKGRLDVAEAIAALGGRTDVDPLYELLGAVMRGDDDRVRELLEADPSLPSRMEAGDRELLPMCASGGHDETVVRLLELGVPIDAPGQEGGTALHYAAWWAEPDTVALLLARGAPLEHETGSNWAPGTPLGWAVNGSAESPVAAERAERYVRVAELLVEAGARIDPGWVDAASDGVAMVLEDALSVAR
jgi:ankyrin repeat protein